MKRRIGLHEKDWPETAADGTKERLSAATEAAEKGWQLIFVQRGILQGAEAHVDFEPFAAPFDYAQGGLRIRALIRNKNTGTTKSMRTHSGVANLNFEA